eukprot:1580688-Amphidinium_carterae.1
MILTKDVAVLDFVNPIVSTIPTWRISNLQSNQLVSGLGHFHGWCENWEGCQTPQNESSAGDVPLLCAIVGSSLVPSVTCHGRVQISWNKYSGGHTHGGTVEQSSLLDSAFHGSKC